MKTGMTNQKTLALLFGLMTCAVLWAHPTLAMDPIICDHDLDAITGHAGVSIHQEGKPSLTVSFTGISWGDADGIPGHTTPGYLILEGLNTMGNVMPAEFLISFKDSVITLDAFTATGPIDFTKNGSADMVAGQSGIRIGVPYVLWNSNLPNIIRVSMNQSGVYSAGDDLIELRLANFIMDMSSSPTALVMWPH